LKLRTRGEIQLANGKAMEAVKTFEAASAQEAPAGNREYLGRALTMAAGRLGVTDLRRHLLEQAAHAYAVVATIPGFFCCRLADFPPGSYADQIKSYILIGNELRGAGTDWSSALAEYNSLRHNGLALSAIPSHTLSEKNQKGNDNPNR